MSHGKFIFHHQQTVKERLALEIERTVHLVGDTAGLDLAVENPPKS